LRDIDSGLKQQGVDRAFFKTLEEFLKISDSNLKEIRRAVADWRDAGATEKSTIRYKIKNLLHMTNQQNDLLIQFRTKL
jgi:signal transduction histidine kinase